MNIKRWTLAAVAALLLAGCGTPDAAAPTATASPASPASPASAAYDLGSIKKGDEALCAVCVVKEGRSEAEVVAETLDYQGKTYAFCNESEKAEFISSPAKYAGKP